MSKWTKLSAVLTIVVVLLGCSSAAMAFGGIAVGDRVWYDDNNNGIQDTGELGINGVTVTLTKPDGTTATATTATTDVAGLGIVDGYYVFGGLAPNSTYTVTLTAGPGTPLEGFTKTSTVPDATNLDHGATVLLLTTRKDVDFGYYKPVVVLTYEVGDRVWHDVDEDGVQDGGELGINGATVTLYKKNTDGGYDAVSTDTTAGDGLYKFSGLSLGDYRIDVSGTPTGWYNTFDISAPFNSSATFELTANRYDVDFGYAMTPTGDFCTFTQGGWGAKPSGNNPGKLLHTYWSTVFPNGLVVGGTKTLTFNTAQQVTDFLPQGGTAAALKTSYPLAGQTTFPKKTEAGVLAGQVVAMKLSVSFSNKGIAPCSAGLGALIIQSGPYAGYTCANFLDLAEKVLGGDITNVSISAINDTATKINECFDNGTVKTGFLK